MGYVKKREKRTHAQEHERKKKRRIKRHSLSLNKFQMEKRESYAKRSSSSIHHIHTHAHLDQLV
jgi:hypothetical protein